MTGKQQDFRTEKYIRYGIRKYSFGAASVAIAAGLMFLGNGAVSATEVQGTEVAVASTTSKAQDGVPSSDKGKSESGTASANATVESGSEAIKVADKVALTNKVAALEAKLSTAKKADAAAQTAAKEVLVSAKAILAKADASQADVDAEVAKVVDLTAVLTESDATAQKAEETKKAEEAKKAETATPITEAKKVLDQVTSEAEVTNVLAEEAVRKNHVEGENKEAIEAAVAKNKEVIAEAKKALDVKDLTIKEIDVQLSRLNESILAVYNDLKKAGIGRDGKLAVALAPQDFYAESTANSNGTRTTHSTPVTEATATGKDIYKFNPDGTATRDGSAQSGELNPKTRVTGGTAEGLEVVVYSNQPC